MGILEDKILALSDKTIEKQNRLSGYSDSTQQNQEKQKNINTWTPSILESMTDADSPQFVGTTGGLGGVDKLTGKRYDLTGKETEDRIEGFDAYEVPHPGDNYKNTESGKRKFDMQRSRLASELGLNPNEVTDDMIYQKGTEQQLMALYKMIPGEKAEWTPGPLDYINENTPLELGSKEYPLNIEVDRFDTGKYGHFGRPLTDVRNIDTKEGIGESIGYEKPKFEQVAAKDALNNIASKYGTSDGKNIQMPSNDGIIDRGINIAKAPVAMALNWALDTGDFLTGLVNEDYANAIFGDAKSRTDAVNKSIGYDSRYSEENIKAIKDIAVKNMSEQISESDKGWLDKKIESYDGVGSEFAKRINNLASNIDSKEALDILKLGLTNPETAVEFFGVIALEALGSKGAGMLTKAGKVQKNIDNVNDAVKTGKLTPESGALKIEQIKDANGISKMNELTYNVAKNSPLVALSYGQANRQDEEFYENTGRHMDASELTGAAMMNMLSFKLEKFADMSIVKGIPDVSNVVDKTLSKLPKNVASKIAGGLLGAATKLSAGAAGETGQEAVQGLIETLNTYNLTGEDAKALTKEQEAKIAEEVAVGALAAPGSSVLLQTPMTAASMIPGNGAVNKLNEKISELKDSAVNTAKNMKNKTSDIISENPNDIVAKEDAKDAEVNVANYNSKLDNITARIAAGDINDSEIDSMLDDITEASLYASTSGNSGNIDRATQDIIYNKVVENNRALKELMASKRDDVLKNGNTSRMQSLASDPKNKEKFKKMLDITDDEGNAAFGEIDFNDEVIAKNYMKAGIDAGLDEETLNDIKDEYVAVSTIRKSIGDVSKEVSTGARGYLTYKKNVEDAINEENLDKIEKNLNKMDKFVANQQSKLSVLNKAIAEVEAEVISTGKNSGVKSFTYPSGQKFEINYKNVYDNLEKDIKTDGIYSIRNAVSNEVEAMAIVAELTAKEVSKKIEGFKKSSEDIASLTNEYKNLVAKDRKDGLNKSDKKRLEFLGKKIKELSKDKKDESSKKQEDKKPIVDKKPPEDITYKAPVDKILDDITYKDEEITYSDNEVNEDENISGIDFDKLSKEKPMDISKAPVDNDIKQPVDKKFIDKDLEIGDRVYKDVDFSRYVDTSNTIDYKDTMNDIDAFNKQYKDFDIDSNSGALESKKIEKSEAIKAIENKIEELKSKIQKDYEVQQKLYDYLNSDVAKEKYSKEDIRENFAKLEKISVSNKINRDKINKEIKLLQDKLTGTAHVKEILDNTSSNMNAVTGQRIRVSEIVEASKVGKNRLSGMKINEITDDETVLSYKDEAIKVFEEMLLNPNDKITNRNIIAKDSLFRGILFGLEDKNAKGDKVIAKINENVAVAIALAADEYYAFMSSKLAYNDKDAIAAMLGIQPHEVSPEIQKAFAYEGVFKKLVADNLGKAVFNNLSIVGRKDADNELIAKMISDAGQMALIYMESKGYIEPLIKSSMPISKYKAATGKNDDKDIKEDFKDVSIDEDGKATSIPMVKLKKPMNGKKYSKSEKKLNDKLKAKALENIGSIQSVLLLDKNSKGPLFTKPKDLLVNKVKNSKVNKVANKSFKVLNKARQEAYEVNSEAVNLMLEKSSREETLSIMGFKTEDALEKMGFDDRESAEARNREIEESYDNLIALHEKVAGKDATEANEMYFEYFFGKNGRFYMDSVTVNPQTDKLHRFLVTLKAHRQVMDFNSPDAEKNKQKEYFKVAIAQAFGFSIDKKTPQEIYDFADAVLEQDEKTLSGALKSKKHKVEIEKYGKKYEVEIEHLGHFFQGLNAIGAYKKAGNGERPFEVSLSVEFDAITSGFILKLLQLPIMSFEKMKLWLSKGGVFLASTDEEKNKLDSITNSGQEISEGRLIDSYRTLASGMKSNIKLSKDMKKHESIWKAMQEVLPKLKDKKTISKAPNSSTKEDEDGESRLANEVVEIVTSEGRSLFKDPFMTFGYAAAIKSIKRHLGYKMISGLPSMMIDESSKESIYKANKFINSIHGKELTEKELKAFKERLKNESFEDIKIVVEQAENGRSIRRNVNIAELMRNIIEDTYGANVEEILTAEFGELIEANNRINNSFKIMFQAWKVAYDTRVQEISGGKGLTADQENEVLEELKVLFPMIKAPLAGENYIEDGETVAIFSTGLTNAKSGYGPTQTHVNPDKFDGQKTLTVQSMIREFQAAISAGAVVPIHYIDGSAMTKSLEEGGVLGVHDAKLTGINNAQDEIIKYNKDVYEISKDYSLAKEILKSLERVRDNAKELGVDLSKLEGVYAGLGNPLRTFYEILDEMRELNEVAESGRKLVYKANAKIGHMAGLDGSMYEVKGGKVVEPKDRKRLTIKAPEKKESIKKESKPVEVVSETINLVMVKDKNGNGIISFKGKGKLSSPSMEVTSYEQLKDIADQYNSIIKFKNKIQDKYIKYVDEMFETFANKGIAFAPIKIEFKKDKDIEGFGSHSVDKENGRSVLEFASTIDYRGDYPPRIVLHEYAHAITVKALQDNPSLLKKAKKLRDHVLANATDKQKKEFYGLYGDKIDKDTQDEEVYEFIAEAMSSPKFQEFLSGIESTSSNPSVLKDIQNFFKVILDFIVKKDEASALTDALEIVLELNGYVSKEDSVENNTTTGALENNTFEGLMNDVRGKIESLKNGQSKHIKSTLDVILKDLEGCK